MYSLKEYSDNFSGTNGSLWESHKDEPKDPITDSYSFKFKLRLLANNKNRGILNGEIAGPLKYQSNFWKTLEMSLIINLVINLRLFWSKQRNIFCNNRYKTLRSSCNFIN